MLYYLKMNEMKQICKLFIVSAAVAASMTACSSEEIISDVQPVLERSNLTIVLNNEVATKAVSDGNAVGRETPVNSISLFVFGSATTAEADTVFKKGDGSNPFAEGSNNNEFNATFYSAPIGVKNVYVGVNLPEALHKAIAAKGVAAFYEMDLAAQKSLLYPDNTNGFPMFSDGTVSPVLDIKPKVTSKLNVSVKRFVSKVTFETSTAFENNTDGKRTANGATVDKSLTFAMGQMNTKFFPFPQKLGTEYIDPNYSAIINGNALTYQGDFKDEFYDFKANVNWTSATPNVFDGFKEVATSADASDITKFKPGYVLENTNEHKLKGELTYAAVKAKFVPEYTHEYKSSVVTSTENTAQKGDYEKLYVVNNGGTYYYFVDEADAQAYTNANGNISYATYVDCICFYNVYLNPSEYDVLRNDYYKVIVENIARLGSPYPGSDDPTLELGGMADLEVTIKVQEWNMVEQKTTLGKE